MKLAEARKNAGILTTAELAVRAKVSVSTINNIESGRYEREGKSVKPITKIRLCKALKIPVNNLEV